jgi:hypothetical protein
MSYRSKRASFLGLTAAGLGLMLFTAQSLWADNETINQAENGAESQVARSPIIPNAGFDELHVNAGADFTRYRTVLIEDASIEFIPRWVNEHRSSVSNRDIARIKKTTADDLKAELAEKLSADDRYQIVEKAEIDTLLIKPAIVDLNVAAPGSGQNVKLVDSAGYATLSLEMVDAYSNQRIVKLLDRKDAKGSSGREYFMANRASNAREFKLMMAAWAERVRSQLDLLNAPRREEKLSTD